MLAATLLDYRGARLRFWLSLVQRDVYGIGLYAVNARGRGRWSTFPSIHSDDKFVRLNFDPDERVKVQARYHWPLPEGWTNLLRMRLRWTEGNLEIKRKFPALTKGEARSRKILYHLFLVLRRPASFVVFFSIYMICRLIARADVETAQTPWRRAR
jgi:hypothetical protein